MTGSGGNIVWQSSKVSRSQRPHQGATLWLTGLSGSTKSSPLAIELGGASSPRGAPAYPDGRR